MWSATWSTLGVNSVCGWFLQYVLFSNDKFCIFFFSSAGIIFDRPEGDLRVQAGSSWPRVPRDDEVQKLGNEVPKLGDALCSMIEHFVLICFKFQT